MDFVFHAPGLDPEFRDRNCLCRKCRIGSGGGASGIVVPFRQALGDFAFQASGKADQSRGMFGEEFLADARLVIKAVQRGFRGDLHQIAVAFFVLGEHQQVVVSVAFGRRALDVVIVFFADIKFAADDRLDAVLWAALTKCTAPKIFPWSVMATAGMPSSFTRWQSFSTSQAPSSRE